MTGRTRWALTMDQALGRPVEQLVRRCPISKTEWADELAKQDGHVGLLTSHPLNNRVHGLLIDAQCIA
jgi:hypothetical protein